MGRSANQKLKMVYLMDFLLRETDEEHPKTTQEIIKHLRGLGISAERKTVYDDLALLRDYGLDILMVKAAHTAYYVGERRFQLSELKLLVDSVQSSRFITGRKTSALIDKLGELTSVYDSGKLKRQVHVAGRIKSMNESIYYTVDAVQEAISAGKKISFQYFDYNILGEQVLRHQGKRYLISPAGLMWDSEKYYLVGTDEEGIQRSFRVDKMTFVRKTEQKVSFPGGKPDMSRYTASHFGMFSGQEKELTLEFDRSMVGAVIDRFGKDTMMFPAGEERFTIHVKVAVSPQFYGWLCGLGKLARLKAPAEEAEKMADFVRNIAALYE